MFTGLLFVLLVKLFVYFCKDENIVIYILIHTIQLSFFFSIQKLHTFFFFFFLWFCLTCKLEN